MLGELPGPVSDMFITEDAIVWVVSSSFVVEPFDACGLTNRGAIQEGPMWINLADPTGASAVYGRL